MCGLVRQDKCRDRDRTNLFVAVYPFRLCRLLSRLGFRGCRLDFSLFVLVGGWHDGLQHQKEIINTHPRRYVYNRNARTADRAGFLPFWDFLEAVSLPFATLDADERGLRSFAALDSAVVEDAFLPFPFFCACPSSRSALSSSWFACGYVEQPNGTYSKAAATYNVVLHDVFDSVLVFLPVESTCFQVHRVFYLPSYRLLGILPIVSVSHLSLYLGCMQWLRVMAGCDCYVLELPFFHNLRYDI